MAVRVDKAVWRHIVRQTAELRQLTVRIGVLASKGGSRTHAGSDASVADIAAMHELGLGVPERSFIRSTLLVRVADQLKQRVAQVVKAVYERGVDARVAAGTLGAWGAAEVKNTITQNEADGYGEFPYPPLADSTIARKGSSKPLVDTGQLLNAITWEVVEGKR